MGGNEQSTHKYVSELIGKETVDTASHSRSRGRSGSYSTSEQQVARDLLTPDEVRLLPDGKAVLFVRGERPVIDDKYDLLRHPCIRFTEDGGASPYDYTAAAGAANDLPFDYTAAELATDDLPGEAADWELLDIDDFLPQPKRPQPPFRTIHNRAQRRNAHESLESQTQLQNPRPAE